MAERQLADLLVSIGLDRNVDIEQIASELAALSLPGYIDNTAFQNSLLDSVESQLRKQTDERIRLLRQQMAAGGVARGRVYEQARPEPEQTQQTTPQPDPAQTQVETPQDQDGEAPAASDEVPYEEHDATMVEAEDIPEDATMIWKSRDERY